MNKILPSIIFIIILAVLYFAGGSLNCVSVAGFTECWSFIGKNMTSSLCSGNATSCYATTEDQMYNAHISALLSACDKARAENYAIQGTTEGIKNAVNSFFNQTLEARDLCENPATYLVYREYGAA